MVMFLGYYMFSPYYEEFFPTHLVIPTEIPKIQQIRYRQNTDTEKTAGTTAVYNSSIDYDYKVGDKVLIVKDGILRKAESRYGKEPWTITTVHTNGTIRVQCGSKSERVNIRRVTPFSEDII